MFTVDNNSTCCPHCGMHHPNTCPRIKAIEYHENGTTKRIEFHEPQSPTQWRVPMVTAGMSENGIG